MVRELVYIKSSIFSSLNDIILFEIVCWGYVEEVEFINDGFGLGFGIVGGKISGVVVRIIVFGGLVD